MPGKHEAVKMGVILSNSAYDTLKMIAQIFLPGVGALYFALAGIWGLPYGEQIIGTITAVDAFLGLFLKASSNKYENSDVKYDGVLSDVEGLVLNEDPTNKKELVLKVENPPTFSEEV